jgi:hypothetical protein
MNALTRAETQALPMSAEAIRDHVNAIQRVMQSVMKEGVHYGIVPGAKKKSLYKPGAETLCKTFHIAPSYRVEDLSINDCFRLRVTCVGRHQGTEIVLGEGMGSASSNEEKYKWRRAVCDEEFDLTPEARRRIKFGKSDRGVYKVKQVRAEPDDIENTVLKMACKRAQIAMTLNVTAAGDIFAQDIEDLPEHLRETEDEVGAGDSGRQVEQPQSKSATAGNGAAARPADDKSKETPASDGQIKLIRRKAEAATITESEILKEFGLEKLDGISTLTGNCILKFIEDPAAYRAKAQ